MESLVLPSGVADAAVAAGPVAVAVAVGLAVPLLQAPAPKVTTLSSTAAPSALDVVFMLPFPQ
ncbi:hypothetical protein [Streptacidiphilus albus]|uniref:hypothetical protein n=1 Tax=Streptacidiphilus albus TaxID=105425 RepID=UPI000A947B07|nr:hypothetical protein [Streptacidiphilus albus]